MSPNSQSPASVMIQFTTFISASLPSGFYLLTIILLFVPVFRFTFNRSVFLCVDPCPNRPRVRLSLIAIR
jgi:hypothetical protein